MISFATGMTGYVVTNFAKSELPCGEQGSFRLLVAAIVLTEAVAAVNGTIIARAEGDLGLHSAGSAGRVVHLPRLGVAAAAASVVLLLAGRPAFGAAARLVGEPFLGEEILLGGGENKLGAAVATGQGLVLIHNR